MHFETDELVAEFPLGKQSEERYGEPFFQVHRADLLDILVDALPEGVLRTGARVEDVLEDNAGVTAVLTNGEKINADLLIGADGIHSTVRSSLGLGIEPGSPGSSFGERLSPSSECNYAILMRVFTDTPAAIAWSGVTGFALN